eukprot:2027449-Rhodomonas_salina.1
MLPSGPHGRPASGAGAVRGLLDRRRRRPLATAARPGCVGSAAPEVLAETPATEALGEGAD